MDEYLEYITKIMKTLFVGQELISVLNKRELNKCK